MCVNAQSIWVVAGLVGLSLTIGIMTLVIAHRGASAAFPENTIEAFVGAFEAGADWVELDVRRTRCGSVVVNHDATLTDGTALVELDVGDLPDHIPTLEAVIEVCGPMGVNIEVKSSFDEPDFHDDYPVVKAVLDVIRSRLTAERSLITSFDMGAINAVHDYKSSTPTGFLTADQVGPEVSIGRAVAHGHSAVNPSDDLVTERFVKAAHEAGLRVYPWTIDDPDRMKELISFGVDGIITNKPEVLRALL